MSFAFLPLLLSVASAPPVAGSWRILDGSSKVTVNVFRSGPFAGALHDHHFLSTGVSGTLTIDDRQPASVQGEVTIDARALRETSTELSASDVKKVEEQLHGKDVLNTAAFPTLHFAPRALAFSGDTGRGVLTGSLTLHGVTRELQIPVRVESDGAGAHVTGQASLLQSQFGIQPLHRFLGAIQVKDLVTIDFDVKATRVSAGK